MPLKKPLGLYAGDVEGFATGDFIDVVFGGTGAGAKTGGFNNLSPLTSKGDIIVSNGLDNIRLPVGPDGHMLVGDSALVPGLKWIAPPTGGTGTTIKGTAIINFGSTGNTEASVTVANTSVVANSFIVARLSPLGTVDNDSDEHLVEPTFPKISKKVVGVSFDITMLNKEPGLLFGTWLIEWSLV